MANIPELKIVNWNANGLRCKVAELIYFVKVHNIHAIVITETRLNPTNKIYLPGYTVFRADGTAPQRGVLLAIKSDLKPEQVCMPTSLINLEAVGASIKTTVGRVAIVAAYNSPSRLRPLKIDDVGKIFRVDTRVVAVGDFNARHSAWSCQSMNQNGRNLLAYCVSHGIQINFPVHPTYFPTRMNATPSFIDLSLSKGLSNTNCECRSWDSLSSDHNPVVIKLDVKPKIIKSLKWDLQKANWNEFRKFICENIQIPENIQTCSQLDDLVYMLTQSIMNAAASSIPRMLYNFCGDPLPDEIKELISRKNYARKKWNHQRLRIYKSDYNRLSKEVKYAVAKWRQKLWINRMKSLTSKDYSLWNFVKRLNGQKTIIGPLKKLNNLTYEPKEQAEILSEAYEFQFTNPFPTPSEENLRKYINDIPLIAIQSRGIFHIKPKHIRLAIRKVKLRKAAGYDGVLPIFVRNLPGKAVVLLTKIIQAIISLQYFPTFWKKAEIIPILKPGKDPKVAESYRPISLLSVLGKVAERIILDWLQTEVDERNILPDWQFGFRQAHSALHQVVRIVDYAKSKSRSPVALILLDVAKAFDRVWHEGLIAKLERYGLPSQLCKLLHSFLRDRVFRVRVGEEYSDWKRIKDGTPQGALLSPILYALFTADIIKPKFSEIAQFADDTALIYSNRNYRSVASRMEKDLKVINSYFEKWRLSLNKSKTEAIMLSSRKRHLRRQIKFGNNVLPWQGSVKYLGFNIDRRLKFGPHIRAAANSAKLAARLLWPLIRPTSFLGIDEKILLYKTLVRPRLTYGVQVWWNQVSKSNFYLLERVENKTLRYIANPPAGIDNHIIRVGLEIESIKEFMEGIVRRFYIKCQSNVNVLIAELKTRTN